MGMEFALIAVGILFFFAVLDLMVGVSNDAANFLNSPIGSRVAPRNFILLVASLGILAGVLFSSGMMEVARKGIFNPGFFTMPELITIFMAVMITDVILLDLFNTQGLPTSTTVSIVFELLGAAVGLSIIKILHTENSLTSLGDYINTAKAMVIIMGILLSVGVAFVFGAVVQFLSRLLFTFDYEKRLNRYGAVWGGLALTAIFFFILLKGARGATFMTSDMISWIETHTMLILLYIFVASAIILQILLFLKVNILKPIILIGTFALAMAFAANDLVNFIGVPLAGYHSFKLATASDSPLTLPMSGLSAKVQSETGFLIIAGLIMVVTLWFSKKAKTVTETEVTLGSQEEEQERFESFALSRIMVRMWMHFYDLTRLIIPTGLRSRISQRIDPQYYKPIKGKKPPFDLLRASVNLMVASVIISLATSQKLPLSTTYVTFMVSMGSSFADQAWGRDSAVYRISGVIAVVSGWFLTALIAFSVACLFAFIIYYTGPFGVVGLLSLAALSIWHSRKIHKKKMEEKEDVRIVNLRKIKDAPAAISTTFDHMGVFLEEIRESIDAAFDGLFRMDLSKLRAERRKVRQIQNWSNIIIANIFKAMRLLQITEGRDVSYKYAQTIRRLQKLSDGHRDIVLRCYVHVSNHHSGLLPEQIEDLKLVRNMLYDILLEVETMVRMRRPLDYEFVIEHNQELRDLAIKLNYRQVERIVTEQSKTRLTILYYSLIGNAMMMAKQNHRLLQIFKESFEKVNIQEKQEHELKAKEKKKKVPQK